MTPPTIHSPAWRARAAGLLDTACLLDHEPVIRLLLERVAEVNAIGPLLGVSPLTQAVTIGNQETIRLLLDHGANVNAANASGSTPLDAAVGDDPVFHLLIERGADPKAASASGHTVLHSACHYGSRAVVEKLLELGSDAHRRDSAGLTAFLNAAEKGRADIMRLLREHGAVATDRGPTGTMRSPWPPPRKASRPSTRSSTSNWIPTASGRRGRVRCFPPDRSGWTLLRAGRATRSSMPPGPAGG